MEFKHRLLRGVLVVGAYALGKFVAEKAREAGVSKREWLRGYARHLVSTWG